MTTALPQPETAEARLMRLCNQVLTETTLPPFVGQRCLIDAEHTDPGMITVTFTLRNEQRGHGWLEWPTSRTYFETPSVTDAMIIELIQSVLADQTQLLQDVEGDTEDTGLDEPTVLPGGDKDWPVLRCARCGENHEHVLARRFVDKPVIDEDGTTWDRWGLCPNTGDPILFRSIAETDAPLADES